MYVCMHVGTRVGRISGSIHTYIQIHTNTYIHTYTNTYIHTHTNTYIHTHTYLQLMIVMNRKDKMERHIEKLFVIMKMNGA